MSDNVTCCPHCKGTGEIRISWYICIRYQDCSEWEGPFPTREVAQIRCKELNLNSARLGYTAAVHEEAVPNDREPGKVWLIKG